MNYVLPCVVNSRRVHYLDLVDAAEAVALSTSAADPRPSFVVAMPGGGVPLLTLHRSEIAKTLTQGLRDIPVSDCRAEAQWNAEASRVTITLHASTEAAAPQRAVVEEEPDLYDDEEEFIEYRKPTQPAPAPSSSSTLAAALCPGLQLQWDDGGSTGDLTLSLYLSRHGKLTPDDALRLEVVVRLAGMRGDAIAEAVTIFHAVPPTQLIEAALDFGSEASQAVERRAEYHGPVLEFPRTALPLFNRVREQMPGAPRGPRYVQEDPDSDKFYKSLFFVRKELKAQAGTPSHFLPAEEENLRMMVADDDLGGVLRESHQLPNLKLMRKGVEFPGLHFAIERPGGRTRDVSFEDIRTRAYGSILKNLIAAWLERHLEDTDVPLYARLTLLVPNIYDIADLQDTLGVLRDSLHRLQSEGEGAGRLAGWEVLTISESDAAFLGFYQKRRNLRTDADAYYIVIDCGKGTTDFSIMRCGSTSRPPEPLYRNGFAGAGNLISFAVFQTLVAYLAEVAPSESTVRDFTARQLAAGDPQVKLRLARQIDRLKARFRPDSEKRRVSEGWAAAREKGGENTLSTVTGQPLAVLVDVLESVDAVCDWSGYIKDAVAGIINPVVADLQHLQSALSARALQCAGVFLTGRGFLFEPLRTRMMEALRAGLSLPADAVQVPGLPEDYKSISVDGVIGSPFVMKPDVVGWPILVDTAPPEEEEEGEATNFLNRAAGAMAWMGGALAGLGRRMRTVRRVEAIDPLAGITADFNRHTLRLGDKDLRPAKPAFYQDAVARYDLLYSPTHGIIMRRLRRDGTFDDWSAFDADATNPATHHTSSDPQAAQAARRSELAPSLFPTNLADMEGELLALVKKHTVTF